MKTKLLWLGFLGLFSCFAHGQIVINTNHPNNNSNGSVTFEVQNTNAYDIVITGAQCHLGSTATNNIELLYNTTPDVDTAPPWSFGTVGAGQNGWISAGTGVVFNSNTANGIVSVLSSLSLVIPAGATYQLGLSATTMQYSSLTAGAGINTFSAGGVNLFTGDGISWGGTVYPATPANYPRGIIGGITFVPVIHFAVSVPATAAAGTPFNFTVTALDGSDNIVTGYTGTVHFTSTDGAAMLPDDATLTNGTGTFSATLATVGSQTITATDTVTTPNNGTSAPIDVNAGAATHFAVSAPALVTTGTAFDFTVTARDQYNNTAAGYSGTVQFTSSDANAALPADSTLTNGAGTFSATLATVGNQTITATDQSSLFSGTSGLIFAKTVSSVALVTDCQTTFVAGQHFTATAVVTGSSPTGTVDFLAGGNYIADCTGVTLNGGSATCDTNVLTIGQGALTANYNGDVFNSASGPANLDLTLLDPADVVWRNSFEQVVAGCPTE